MSTLDSLSSSTQLFTTAWSQARRDVMRGAAMVGGRALALAGVVLLSACFTLLLSEEARVRAGAAVLAMVGAEAAATPAEAPDHTAGSGAGTWSEWLATAPRAHLEPEQENVVRYLARRYRVAEGAVRQIVGAAFSAGRSLGVDPMLILAVTAIESSLNPFAQSAMGAQGLMQVMTRVHSEKFATHGGDHAALDPIANLRVGSEILQDVIRRGGSVERGLQLYVGAGNLPDDGGYAARVLGEMARIKNAAGGWRADNRVERKAGEPALQPVSSTAPAPASPGAATASI
jgi:hypothetical protein